ncbi:tetraspanin-11 [Medicago truncatula]|uniref:Tetraspanin family protein n=2 Tax=Medicago truncatula TaxID=3880 RepID=A0A072V9H8_MEDTR|nr:tetraspanin-11 [Medicago truncatula]KEH38023.1 tetraspanin family protein [Medicago truncatula]
MFRISNTLVGTLNILTLLLSLAGMAGSAYIHFHKTDCLKVLMYPLLFGAFFVFVVSVLGIMGSMFRINEALYAYLLATFFVILAFMLFTVFALFVTNKVVGQKVSDKGFGEYKVADFSLWLQQYVINDKNWNDIKSCLLGVGLCQRNLSAAGVGCCKPPVQCGFTMKNATFWEVPKTGPAMNDTDCFTWKNKENKLCYDCNSCKGEVLANIRNQWRYLTIFNVCVLILLTSIYVLGCYAIRNNRRNQHLVYHPYGINR